MVLNCIITMNDDWAYNQGRHEEGGNFGWFAF